MIGQHLDHLAGALKSAAFAFGDFGLIFKLFLYGRPA
jgi:hypothetical protein